MKKLIDSTIHIVLILLLTACGQTAASPDTVATESANRVYKVGIIQQTTHPTLDGARKGVEEAFEDSGLEVQLIEKNAQNDIPTLTTIAEGFRDDKVDLVITIGTLPLQSAYQVLKDTDIPIVFNTVVDPYKAGVAQSETDHPGISGVHGPPPVTKAFDLILELNPNAIKIGNIWNPTEKNSELSTSIAREYAKSNGLVFLERQVAKADEVLAAAEALASEGVDAIFISTDSTVVGSLESVVKVANENKIPLICNDPPSASRGCVAALGLDYPHNGRLSVEVIAIPILKGEKTADEIPIIKEENFILALNKAAAQSQGVILPQALLERADQVFEEITPNT